MKVGVMMRILLSISALQKNRMAQHLSFTFEFALPNLTAFAPQRGAAWLCALVTTCVLSACGGGSGSDTSGSSTVTIGGKLTGLTEGQTLTLSLGTQTLIRSTNGGFTFSTPVAQGTSYSVLVSGQQPAWQTCSVTSGNGTASANVSNVAVSCVSADTAATGLLNDTGVDWCTEYINATTSYINYAICTIFSRQQDAFFGRDAYAQAGVLNKTGTGMAGFDFTRIGASGKLLVRQDGTWSDNGTEADGTQWDCIRDNTTGLVWEVKRNDSTHLRHVAYKYTWFNPDNTINGGNAGTQTGGICKGVSDNTQCNTQSYVAAVNVAGLCGKKDWRLPTVDELRNLAHTGRANPAIDVNHFPNTANDGYWSSSASANVSDLAWGINFYDGGSYTENKNYASRLRLVRSSR